MQDGEFWNEQNDAFKLAEVCLDVNDTRIYD